MLIGLVPHFLRNFCHILTMYNLYCMFLDYNKEQVKLHNHSKSSIVPNLLWNDIVIRFRVLIFRLSMLKARHSGAKKEDQAYCEIKFKLALILK